MSTASRGRAAEYRVRDEMVAAGWVFLMRAAASKGPADLLLACPERGIALVQVGHKSKSIGPTARARFMEAAWLCSALPILAVVYPRHPTRYHLVTSGTPSTWQEFQP